MYRTHTYVCVFNAENLGKLISISCFSLLRLKYICGARQETPEQASKNLTQKHINKIYKISTRTHRHTHTHSSMSLHTLPLKLDSTPHTLHIKYTQRRDTHRHTHTARTTLWQQFYLFLYFPYPAAIKGSSGNAHTKRKEIKKFISMTKFTFNCTAKCAIVLIVYLT